MSDEKTYICGVCKAEWKGDEESDCPACSSLAPARGYAAMRVEAEAEAQKWEPFTQNHDPSYWKALRDAYASGYVSGASAEQRRHNARTEPRAVNNPKI